MHVYKEQYQFRLYVITNCLHEDVKTQLHSNLICLTDLYLNIIVGVNVQSVKPPVNQQIRNIPESSTAGKLIL